MGDLATTILYDAVSASLEVSNPGIENAFGWRRPARQMTTDKRVVWVPGDASGSLGVLGPARQPGRNPRPIATLHELVSVHIFAFDPADAEDERLQYIATRDLFDAWLAAVRSAYQGRTKVLSVFWDNSKNTRRRGAEIIAVLAVEAAIYGVCHESTEVDAAEIDVEQLGVTETVNAA
jgi:hypothetical protein